MHKTINHQTLTKNAPSRSKILTNFNLVLAALIILKLLAHFLTSSNYELHRDAYLYIAQSNHLAFGYWSTPPFTAFMAKISALLFGESIFAYRLFPALTGAASLYLIGLIVKTLRGSTWALLLAGSAFLFSVAFLRSNSLLQPVSYDQFFWLLSFFLIVKMISQNEPRYWLYIAVAWGLGFLNKYSMVIFALPFVAGLLLTPRRRLLFSSYTLYGLGLGFLIILPNIIWQHTHNWIVFHHISELAETQFVNVSFGGFMFMQGLMNLHALPLWLGGLFFLLFSKGETRLRALGYATLIIIFGLALVQAKAYYTLGIYSGLFAIGGVAFERWFRAKKAFIKPLLLAFIMLANLPVLPFALPLLKMDKMVDYSAAAASYGLESLVTWEDGRVYHLPQDYADMTGWRELTQVVATAWFAIPESQRDHIVIYAENYGLAGAVNFYGNKMGLPEAISFHDSFAIWAPDTLGMTPDSLILIYINDDSEDVNRYFKDVREAGLLENPYARESGMPVYICRNPIAEFPEIYLQIARQNKSRFAQ